MSIELVFSPLPARDLAITDLSIVDRAGALGTLLDADGFPACVHGGPGRISGTLHRIAASRAAYVLTALDALHGTHDSPQRRTIVRTTDGGPLAWAWHWTGPADLPTVDGGDWEAHVGPRLL